MKTVQRNFGGQPEDELEATKQFSLMFCFCFCFMWIVVLFFRLKSTCYVFCSASFVASLFALLCLLACVCAFGLFLFRRRQPTQLQSAARANIGTPLVPMSLRQDINELNTTTCLVPFRGRKVTSVTTLGFCCFLKADVGMFTFGYLVGALTVWPLELKTQRITTTKALLHSPARAVLKNSLSAPAWSGAPGQWSRASDEE